MERRRQIVAAALLLTTAVAVLVAVIVLRTVLSPSPTAATKSAGSAATLPATSAQPAASSAVQPSPVTVTPKVAAGQAVSVVGYRSPNLYSGSQLFGLYAKPGTTLVSPLAGKVTLHSGTSARLPAGKSYALLTVTAADRTELAMFFGVIGSDVEPLVADNSQIQAGAELVKITGTGANMWYYGAKDITPFQAIGFWQDPAGKFVDVSSRTNLFGA